MADRIFVSVDEAGAKLGLADNPMIEVFTNAANMLIDDYVDENILETNQLAKLGVLKYIEFMNIRKAGIKSVTDIDVSTTYDTTTASNLPSFIAELLLPIKKQVKYTNGFSFL